MSYILQESERWRIGWSGIDARAEDDACVPGAGGGGGAGNSSGTGGNGGNGADGQVIICY
jgi:hypothetical protein